MASGPEASLPFEELQLRWVQFVITVVTLVMPAICIQCVADASPETIIAISSLFLMNFIMPFYLLLSKCVNCISTPSKRARKMMDIILCTLLALQISICMLWLIQAIKEYDEEWELIWVLATILLCCVATLGVLMKILLTTTKEEMSEASDSGIVVEEGKVINDSSIYYEMGDSKIITSNRRSESIAG